MVTVGNVTTTSIDGLVDGVTYYFTATARDSSGLESDPSNEIFWTATSGSTSNQTPTLNQIAGLVLAENAPAQNVALSGISAGVGENQPLTVTATSDNPALITALSVVYTSPSSSGTLSFSIAPYMWGSAVITVKVTDGQLNNNSVSRSFQVTVNSVNQAPSLNLLSDMTIPENSGLQTVNLAGIGSGAPNESQVLTVTAVSSNPALIPAPRVTYVSPAATGTLTFTPAPNFSGTATISVTVDDGGLTNNLVSRSFRVTVQDVNQAPTLDTLVNLTLQENAGPQTVNLKGISSGATNESQVLTVTAASSHAGLIPAPKVSYASPSATGTLTLTPAANASGVATITVTVSDGGVTNSTVSRSFQVTVVEVNQAPTLDALADVTISENAGVQTVGLKGISSGTTNESQLLSVTAVSSNPSLIPAPKVNYVSPATTGSLTFTPAVNLSGTATITVTVSDGGVTNNSVSRSFQVRVSDVNQAPTLNALADLSIQENAGLQTVNLSGISTGATNESQVLTVTAVSSNPALVPTPRVTYLSPSATGTLSFTPAANATGTATITVTVSDGSIENNELSRSFRVVVTDVNQPPTLEAIADIVSAENAGEQAVQVRGISSGSASESQLITVVATSSNPVLIPDPEIEYLSPNATGTLRFSPRLNTSGSAVISVTVSDGGLTNSSISRSFSVTVTEVNQAPTLDAIADLSVLENAGAQAVILLEFRREQATNSRP
jgi:hypothetical protein